MELGTVGFIGMIVLGLALAWGVYQNHRRNRRRDRATDAATTDLYENPQPPTGTSKH